MARSRKSKKQKKGPVQKTVSFFVFQYSRMQDFFAKRKIFSSINIINVFFVLVAMLFVWRLYDLQVVRGEEFRDRIDNQYTKEERGKSISRGDIFFQTKDGTEILAATMRPLYTVAIEPKKIQNKEALYSQVNAILPINKASFIKKASKANDPYEEIAEKIDRATVDELKKIEEPGMVYVLQKDRFYPGGSLGSNLLGFMSFTENEFSGSYGLEKYYDHILRRDTSVKTTSIFASLFSGEKETEESRADIKKNIAKEGSLVLTVEPTVQSYLENQLDGIVSRWRSRYAAGVVIDPKTGAIVAMGVSDNFDLNKNTRHYRNYLVEDRLELGSIIKPLTVAIGLNTGAITSDFSYNDKGTMTLDRYPISNYDKKGRGPYTDLQKILTNSLNTGVATIALRIGHTDFKKYFYGLGFAEETGIDLPFEVYGLTSNLESGRDVEIATASFGQGIAITPMEAVRALSTIAYDGTPVTPYLVDSIEYGDLIPSKNIVPQTADQVFTKQVVSQVQDYMVNIVDDSDTFRPYSNPNYSVGIKTGTAQIAKPTGGYYSDRFLHSFVGFFPAKAAPDEDRYLVLLYTVEPKGVRYSSTTLKDPFFNIVNFMINYYELPPDRLDSFDTLIIE